MFPVAYIISAAFNADNSLSGSSLIPRHVTLDNFRSLFQGQQATTGHATFQDAHYLAWFGNSMIVAGATALLTVLMSALAAYAFSRFRFRGRRLGMVALLLIQMFPQLLAIVAIYLIVLNVGDIFPFMGLNTLSAVVLVYLGGALGVNTWLMKGFFDTIPKELDESARVDGATPAQVFWGVVLPLAAPVLAVIALISFVVHVERVRDRERAAPDADKFTLAVGMQSYIDQKYSEHWGPFAAGVLIASIPVVAALHLPPALHHRRPHAGAVKG